MGPQGSRAMFKRLKDCAERINDRLGSIKRPVAADPMTAIAPLLRVHPEIQEICRFAERWEAEHQAEQLGWAQFHIVTKGRCFLEQRCGEPLLLQAGHLLLLPHGDAHVVRSAGRKAASERRYAPNSRTPSGSRRILKAKATRN